VDKSYDAGKFVGQQMLLAAAKGNWAQVVELDNRLDPNNDSMMDGYNDGIYETLENNTGGVDSKVLEAVIAYVDQYRNRGIN